MEKHYILHSSPKIIKENVATIESLGQTGAGKEGAGGRDNGGLFVIFPSTMIS